MELPAPLQQHQPVVERELRALLEEHAGGGLPLYRMMQHQLGWVDESGEPLLSPPPDRLYGALCLEAAATEGDPAAAGPAAAAAELVCRQGGSSGLRHRIALPRRGKLPIDTNAI